jgi:4-hydroxy-3-polyprenylbenzoate decarboxylase
MGYYQDLREFVLDLEKLGKLHRWKQPINKDTELMPLHRCQFLGVPEEERKVFLFERVTDARGRTFSMKVLAGVYALSRQIMALGMGCQEWEEVGEKWHHALSHQIEPELVDSGPAQEEIHMGSDLVGMGLDELPVCVEEPGFTGTVRVSAPFITRDPDSGIRNVGMYSGHLRSRDRLIAGISRIQHAMLYHWNNARRKKQPLPVAIVLGTTPAVVFAASAKVPYGVDELGVAGGISGRAIELVRCKTVPLEVPANAEVVIEGEISDEVVEPYPAFGDYPGYMDIERSSVPVIKVTAITHRSGALFPPILVGFLPSENSAISRMLSEVTLFNFLKHSCNLPMVLEVHWPEAGAGLNWCVIRMKKLHPSQSWQVLRFAASACALGKVFIAVDEDVNPRDPNLVMWALCYAMQPHRDMEIMAGRVPGLDPSGILLAHAEGGSESYPGSQGASSILIDATRKGPYPPVALPRKEFMEKAVGMWKAEKGLPNLTLSSPWHGYELGLWSEDDQENAELIVQGKYLELGEKMARRQSSVGEAAGEARFQKVDSASPEQAAGKRG